MKNFVLALMLGLGVLTLTSCKKEYTCECVATSTMPGFTSQTTTHMFTASKADAEEACDGLDSSTTSGGFTTTNACDLK